MGLFRKKPSQKPELGRRRPEQSTLGTPPVFSYHTRRTQELGATGRQIFREAINPENASRAARYWVRRFGLLVIVIVALVSLVNVLIISPDPKVTPIDPSETIFLHDTAAYQRAASRLFSDSILNRNKVTVNTESIRDELKRQFPELAIVSIKLPLIGHRPIIYIEPTKPVLLLGTMSNQTYVVDENGRALGNAREVKLTGLSLVHVADQSGTPVRVGQLSIPTDTVSFIESVLFQLNQKQMRVSTFILPAGKSELDMYLEGHTYFVRFNVADNSPEEQVGTFLAVKHQLEGQGASPSQYIDVRVAGRAYYK